MTSQIMPFNGPSTPTGSQRQMPFKRGDAVEQGVFESELAASDRVLAGQDDCGAPPAEVLDQVAAAGRISREMSESGHELRFSGGQGGRVTVELSDRKGKTVKSIPISEALELAVGKPLHELSGKRSA